MAFKNCCFPIHLCFGGQDCLNISENHDFKNAMSHNLCVQSI